MKICALCDKGSVTAGTRSFLRSHYNPTGTIRKYPNLQWARLASGEPRTISGRAVRGERKKICVKCMKKLHAK